MATWDDLVAYWTLAENSSTQTDLVGSNDLSAVNSPTYNSTGGPLGAFHDFKAADSESFTVAGQLGETMGTEGTVCCWASCDSVEAGGAMMFTLGDCFSMQINGSSKFDAFFHDGNWKGVTTSATGYDDSTWRHYAFVKSSSGLTLYIDGSSVATDSDTGTISYNLGDDTWIGKHGDGGTGWDFDGGISDVAFFDVAKSSTDISAIYNSGDGLRYSADSGFNMKINIGDSWKDVEAIKINIGDSWKDVDAAKINIGDAFKTV